MTTLVCDRRKLFCCRCGMELEYFFSFENATWFVAHHALKNKRETMSCRDADIVWYAPKLELTEAL